MRQAGEPVRPDNEIVQVDLHKNDIKTLETMANNENKFNLGGS